MPSESEGRIFLALLALQAYTSNHIPSLRATANTYDAPFETLRERHLGVLSREETIPHSQKFSNNEGEVLLRKIFQLSTDGFPLQRTIAEEMANITLQAKNPACPPSKVRYKLGRQLCKTPTRALKCV